MKEITIYQINYQFHQLLYVILCNACAYIACTCIMHITDLL